MLHDPTTEIVGYHVERPAIAPTITTASITSPATGQLYTFQLTAAGSAPITWTYTGRLPAGLSMNEAGTISGTPKKAGKSTITVTASNSVGNASQKFIIQVFDPVSITTASLKSAKVNKAYSVTLKAKGTKPLTWSAEGLPSGLSINASTGRISGKPTVYGSFSVNITAGNGAGSVKRTLNFSVDGIAPKLSGNLAKSELGKPYSSGLKLTAGSLPVTWSITGTLPEGLTFDTETGIISGTPSSYVKSSKLTITATNDAGSKSKKITLTVKGMTPRIKTAKLPDATAGTPYSAALSAAGSEPITWRAEGLPDGLTLDGDTITGTPSSRGSARIIVYAVNPVKTVKKTLTLKVNAPTASMPEIPDDEHKSSLPVDDMAGRSTMPENSAGFAGGYVIVAELGTISADEAGMYDFTVTLSDDSHVGAELVYIANSDNPSDDDGIAEFFDADGEQVSTVPDEQTFTVSVWLNPGTVYSPVIAVK